jgi:hypothetical protein
MILCLTVCFHLLSLQSDPAALNRALKWTWITGGVLTLVLVVAWPLLALPAGVFSKPYFTMWIVSSELYLSIGNNVVD